MVKKSDREIKSIVVSYLWDLPGVVEDPKKLLEAVERYKKEKNTATDAHVVRLFKSRLSQTEEGRKLYKEFFNEDPPPPKSYFITPNKLAEMLERSV